MNPRIIQIGITKFVRETNNPNYYNVNGRNWFERLHIRRFPKEEIRLAKLKN